MHDQQIRNAMMRAARGGNELRRGGTVMLRLPNGACGLCRAAELSDVGDIINYSENVILQIILQGCNSNNNYNKEGYFKIKQTTSNPKFYLNEI